MHGLHHRTLMVCVHTLQAYVVTFHSTQISIHSFYFYCSTPPRVYRQAATLMGLQLVTSFISVANTLGSQRETTQRQLNAESKKNADGPRVESLNKRLSVTHEQITTLEDMMRKIFTG